MTVQILRGDCREVLRTLEPESVHCVVTSPPYWGLRDYGVEPSIWGGDEDCAHEWGGAIKANGRGHPGDKSTLGGTQTAAISKAATEQGCFCHCGAWRGAHGLEPFFDLFIANEIAIFAEVRRVLRGDGTLWLNLGDSYATGTSSGRKPTTAGKHGYWENPAIAHRINRAGDGLKPKDLCGIPWRVAFALQADGWWLRQDIIWSKPNPMPESVTDRCTKAHEYLFLLSKSERYYYDQDAIAEPCSPSTHARISQDLANQIGTHRANGGAKTNAPLKAVVKGSTRKLAEAGSGIKCNDNMDAALAIMPDKRNKRSVWEVTTQPFSEAHFATFPPALIEPCIKAGCPAGGVVLDPFFGAGTTGMVADRLGRDCIGIELNPDYVAMAERRISGDAGMFASVETK